MAKVPTPASTRTKPDEPIAELRRQLAELRAEVFLVQRALHEHVVQQESELLTERIVVTGKHGVVVLGDLGKEATGLTVTGRDRCTNLDVRIAVDNGEHSHPVSPRASITVGADGGHVNLSAPALPMEAPEIWIEADKGRESGAVRIGHRHMGYGEGADVQGAWIGVLELADGEGRRRAQVDASLLDDVASATWNGTPHERREWERTP